MEFYTAVFGWSFNKFDMPGGEVYWGVTTTPVDEKHRPTRLGEINGGLMKRKAPDQPFMNYIQVDSIDESLKVVVAHGGVVLMPKTEIAPNMGWIAAFRDTENNIMGLHELAPELKSS
jgi:predicted enzyme related to lactoylglutathione lyase